MLFPNLDKMYPKPKKSYTNLLFTKGVQIWDILEIDINIYLINLRLFINPKLKISNLEN
jgi:hypothetical protein